MSIQVVHLHGFKCAGTSIATLMAHNFRSKFRCVESDYPQKRLPWKQLVSHPELLGITAVSSHTVTPPISHPKSPLVIGLVRDPAQRLISAWRFFAKQTSQPDFPFSGYLQRQRRLKNYQARLYSPQLPGLADDGMLLWGQNSDRLRIGYNFFLGTVDRYDESLVIIQYLMELRNIAFAVHSKAENVSQIRESETDAVPEVPEEYIHLDKLLFRRCNQIIDSFREMIPSFENRLMAVQSQKVPTGSDDSFRHLTEPENFVRIRVAD